MNFDNLHQILRSLYEQMMPLCGDMAGVAKGIAGLGALFYVAYRVWQSLARAEPIDVFPMLRPFAIGLCIMFFPTVVLGTINSIMSPVVQGTAKMLEAETLDMNRYREQKDKLEYEAMMRNPETAYLVSNEEFDKQLEELGWSPGDMVTMAGMYIERGMYNMKKGIRDFFREILELMFQINYLCDYVEAENGGYYKAVNRMPYCSADFDSKNSWVEYGHTMEDYLGGQIESGFVIDGYSECQLEDITELYFLTKAVKRV